MSINRDNTPRAQGYRFPAEWEKHRATWLSYPHSDSYSWPGTLPRIFPYYNRFIHEISRGEQVCINVRDKALAQKVLEDLDRQGTDLSQITLLIHPTNDAWCRDHGPAFLVKEGSPKAIVNWIYNAWGGKYPADLDNNIPALIGRHLGLKVFSPGIVMEGGAVDFNGKGTVLTTTACLLHENRNPGLSRRQIEQSLMDFYGLEQVLWLEEGIQGDDTNGHVDDITRFFREDAVITMVEPSVSDPNHLVLKANLELLKKFRLPNGKQLEIVELPMPDPVIYEEQRLPASYANFYISNQAVIVPTYRCPQDEIAMGILEKCFPDRRVTGIDSTEIIWGLGSWHCLSQQEPL